MTKHRVKVVMADGGGRLGTGWDHLNTCNSSLVERDRYTYNTAEVTCPECLDVLEREARADLRRIAARREAGKAQAGVKHMAVPVAGSSLPEFVNRCDPDLGSLGSDYTFGLEKVTCPECLDMLEQEAREETPSAARGAGSRPAGRDRGGVGGGDAQDSWANGFARCWRWPARGGRTGGGARHLQRIR